ncbi:UNVERIFIED_CONTAM: Pentatricopeptide repeat-containing protein MRL1, chloroplastic [Sesamum calycinum]|uniref:Pentatricopeptide repeat-containing protein MRL1, chloroplastic n=1 Tax=Sesamum calycinum TaxID=2727403 RepID=A0AAW2M947_9LAMI
MVYRETIVAGCGTYKDELSQVLSCLQLPHDVSIRNRLIENLGLNTDSLIDRFGEYDPRAFSLLEEAASLGVILLISLEESPIVVDVRNFQVHTAELREALEKKLIGQNLISLPEIERKFSLLSPSFCTLNVSASSKEEWSLKYMNL